MFLWLMKGLPERQQAYASVRSGADACVDDVVGQAEWWGIFPCGGEYPQATNVETL